MPESDHDAAPATTATGTPSERGGRTRPRWWAALGAAAVLAALVGVAMTDGWPTAGDRAAEDVALPGEDEVDPAGRDDLEPGLTPGPDPHEAQFECLVDAACVRWRADLGDIAGGGQLRAMSDADGDTLVVAGAAGVAGLDPAGEVLWTRPGERGGPGLPSGVAIADDLVLMAARDQGLLALDAGSGEPRWATDTPDDPQLQLVSARRDGAMLLLQSIDVGYDGDGPLPNVVQGRDAADGTLRWEATGQGIGLVGDVAVRLDGERVERLEPATGKPRWSRNPEAGNEGGDDGDGAPRAHRHPPLGPLVVVDGQALAVGTEGRGGGQVVLLDVATGEVRARVDGRSVPRQSTESEVLVLERDVPEGPGDLVGVDADGEVLWERSMVPTGLEDARIVQQPTGATSEAIAVTVAGAGGGGVHALVVGLASGETVHEAALDLAADGVSPLGRDGLLVHDAPDTTAVAADGSELWRVRRAWPNQQAVEGLVLVQVGGQLLAVEHDPR